mmetsp:Transcript_60621/g.143318  ORF Transcript_60621/g.143318 Transcript_60621/m.143318 type:complete len:218 (-) Transcript_60621:428-1081(-)
MKSAFSPAPRFSSLMAPKVFMTVLPPPPPPPPPPLIDEKLVCPCPAVSSYQPRISKASGKSGFSSRLVSRVVLSERPPKSETRTARIATTACAPACSSVTCSMKSSHIVSSTVRALLSTSLMERLLICFPVLGPFFTVMLPTGKACSTTPMTSMTWSFGTCSKLPISTKLYRIFGAAVSSSAMGVNVTSSEKLISYSFFKELKRLFAILSCPREEIT